MKPKFVPYNDNLLEHNIPRDCGGGYDCFEYLSDNEYYWNENAGEYFDELDMEIAREWIKTNNNRLFPKKNQPRSSNKRFSL